MTAEDSEASTNRPADSGGSRGAPGITARFWHILRILARHGVIGAIRGKAHWPPPDQLRAALEELGVVFLKFGQVLALRRDILPQEYIDALENLHDDLPPMDPAEVRRIIEESLGGSLETHFAHFDTAPLAAATIAQVHRATLADGRSVVVKVRRSGLAELIHDDTAILQYLAALAERVQPRLRSLDAVGMVREFRASLTRETNLLLEGATIGRFRAALTDSEGVWIPDVIREHTAEAVLTTEFSAGERIDRYAERHIEQRSELAERIAVIVLHQIFETGLFHADPHPGNIFVLEDGRICLHDFGMIGEIDAHMREGLTNVLEAFVAADADALADAYVGLGLVGPDLDGAALRRDLDTLLRDLFDRPLEEVSVGQAIASILRVGSAHRVRNPGVLLLLTRAFLIAEALLRKMDPQMQVTEVFRAELERVTRKRYSPAGLKEGAEELFRGLGKLFREAPEELRQILRHLAKGDLGHVQVPGLEVAGQRASRDLERLTGAVASAALVVAGALLVSAGGWHRVVGDVLLLVGIAGTVVTAVGAFFGRRSNVSP